MKSDIRSDLSADRHRSQTASTATLPWTLAVDQLGFVKSVDRLSEGVVVTVTGKLTVDPNANCQSFEAGKDSLAGGRALDYVIH